jgi:hypothetical protein
MAAATAIVKTLESAGLDIHALADPIERDLRFSEADAKEIYQRGIAAGKQAALAEKPLAFISTEEPTRYDRLSLRCSWRAGGNCHRRDLRF